MTPPTVTSTETLTAALNTQTANLVFAEPASGVAVAPHFFKYNGLAEHPASDQRGLEVIAQEAEMSAPQVLTTKLDLSKSRFETPKFRGCIQFFA